MPDVNAKPELADAETAARQSWMRLLARAKPEALENAWGALGNPPQYTVLRAPETGMAMVRARAGGEGQKFNLGEMTVTRCVVRTGAGHMGHAYVAGRAQRHAELAAVFDALLQNLEYREHIQNAVLAPIHASLDEKHTETARKVAATRVEFFTMVRGDD